MWRCDWELKTLEMKEVNKESKMALPIDLSGAPFLYSSMFPWGMVHEFIMF